MRKSPLGYGQNLRLSPRLTDSWAVDAFSMEAVSRRLGVSRQVISRSAAQLGVGRRVRGVSWAFTAAEIEQLRQVIPCTKEQSRS